MFTVVVEYKAVSDKNIHKFKTVEVSNIAELDLMFGENKYFILEMESNDTQNKDGF